ncbi:MAG: hypothetical protein GY939_02255 [Actinomycetia bacterium]|nr:hypothetical protein [Actinomycetes bacterium]
MDRVPHLDGFETISAERSWNPFVGSHEPLVRVRLRPTPSGTTPTTLDPVQEAEKGLTAAGFNTTERLLNLYSRALVQSQERRWPSYEFAELNQEITGTVVVDYTLGGGNRDWLALTTYLGTIIVAIGALIATLGTAARQAAGGFALGATGLQAVLAIRALIRARSLIQDSGFTIGPLSSAHSWAAPTSLAHRELAQQVSNVAHDLYPLGAGALWILIIPWALGSFLTFLRRPGWIVGSIGVWVALATGVSVAFASIHSMLLAILE